MTFLGALLGPLLAGSVLVVAPGGPYQSIPDAMTAAQAGDTIEVHAGTYPGNLVVDRPVTLRGVNTPVLDGGGKGTVVTLAAPGASLSGFAIRGSGSDASLADAGVQVRAAEVVVEDNQLEDVLYGISLDNAPRGVIRRNSIHGKSLPVASRGDGIRLWYSSDVLLEDNRVDGTRDCVVWYSARVRLLRNQIENGRYGLHFMYDDGAEIEGNILRDNSVGAYLMYTTGLMLRDNLLASSRGPSGYGLGLKDVDDVTAVGNWFVDNRVGAWLDSSPRSLDSQGRFHGNVFAYNDIALTLQPALTGNTFSENTFRENLQQVSVPGGGNLRGNRWMEAGRGNYWSDYRGFDADGDGVGDVSYRAETLLGDLMDRRPALRLFQFGLAADAVEFAARAFPVLRPEPKLVDDAPLVSPPPAPTPPGQPNPNPWPPLAGALGLLGVAGAILRVGRLSSREPAAPETRSANPAPPLLVMGLSKRFGRQLAVNDLYFAVERGEAVAVWGPNGAGKSTLLKCLLGLLPCGGAVHITGQDALRRGREARRSIGYVPQEVALHDDLTVAETAAFYASLKGLPRAEAEEVVDKLGLGEHNRKLVRALSGGLRQRLALGLALLGNPPLLLLDEPTSNLDAAGREQVLRLLADLRRRGTAILFASHRLEEVEALADRVLVLEGGKLAFACPPRELASRLGLRLNLRLRIARAQRDQAVAVLQQGGLRFSPNGTSIGVQVLPSEKALPIGLLERAGIEVTDFSIEDGAE